MESFANRSNDGSWSFDGSPFNPCNLLVRFLTKTTLFPFLNMFTNWSCVLYMYSELCTCPNLQMWFNSELTTTERCKIKYAIYMYNEPRTFPNVEVWFSNVATTIMVRQSVRNISTTFQTSKCGLKVQTDPHNRMLWRSVRDSSKTERVEDREVRDWFVELKSSSRKHRFFPTKCTNFSFRSQSQT